MIQDALAVGLHVTTSWVGPSEVEFDFGKVHVVRADTVFRVREALRDAERDKGRVILLTKLQQADLGHDVVARLARSRLFAIDHWASLVRPFQAASDFAGAMSVLCGDRRLLPGQEASARRVLLGRGPPDWTCAGHQRRPQWLWKCRRVYVYDGSSVSMPDTAENQRAYPQPDTQKPGLGFPLARIAAVFSLACGAVLDVGICRYAGKGQSELGMLRTLWNMFRPRRRHARRSPDVHLDRDGDAQAARRRLRLPLDVTPHGRFSPWKTPGQRRSHCQMAQTDEAPFDRPGDLRQRFPSS